MVVLRDTKAFCSDEHRHDPMGGNNANLSLRPRWLHFLVCSTHGTLVVSNSVTRYSRTPCYLMFIKPLERHLHVCAQVDLPSYSKRDPRFWNVISIREPYRPIPNAAGFRKFHTMLCLDVVGTDGMDESELVHAPRAEHLESVFHFADSVPGEPVLVHCWAGVSRSTAVALALIVRAMHLDGYSEDEIVKEACEVLLEIRPQAAPNPMVLEIGFCQFMDAASANRLMIRLVNDPALFGNRHKGAAPSA